MSNKRVYDKSVELITMSVKLPLAQVEHLRRVATTRGYAHSVGELVREALGKCFPMEETKHG